MTLAGLAARNVLRNKFRAILTAVGVAVAILTFILLRTVVHAWSVGADYAMKDRLVTRNKVTFVMTVPRRYIDELRAAPHVRVATYANWFGGKDPKHEHEFFGTIAIDADSYFQVFDDLAVDPAVLDAFKHDPQAAIVGEVLAKKMGWKPGDKVMLVSGIYPEKPEWEFHIVGLYSAKARSADKSSFYFRWDYLDKSVEARRQNQIGWMVSRVDEPTKTASIGVAVDKLFDSQEIQTLSQDEHAFQASFLASASAILGAIDIVSAVILVIMSLVLGNTIAMGVRERTNEYGVLKALGFSNGHIAMFIVAESMLLAAIGGALGILISYPFVQNGLGRWLEENMGSFFPFFRVDPGVVALAAGLSLALGAAAAIIPAYTAMQLKVVDALRRVA
ncbi:MAG TPA: FtsX-like permease family protein [Byssovorax sp.]